MAAKYMIHPETSEVYPYNERYIKERSFRAYNGPLPVIDPIKGVRILSEECEFEQPKKEGANEVSEAGNEKTSMDKRKAQMVEAFGKMTMLELTTANGLPRLLTIEKYCGFKPSLEERQAAWDEYKGLDKKDADIGDEIGA